MMMSPAKEKKKPSNSWIRFYEIIMTIYTRRNSWLLDKHLIGILAKELKKNNFNSFADFKNRFGTDFKEKYSKKVKKPVDSFTPNL